MLSETHLAAVLTRTTMKKILTLILICSALISKADYWTQKANFGGTARTEAAGFSIGTYGYIGTGNDGSNYLQDFWQWNQGTNTWTQKASITISRQAATGFSIGSKGYICCGYNGSYLNDLWEYDPSNNQWTQKADFPSTGRRYPISFSIGNKGYVGTGNPNGPYETDLWEYDPSLDTWTSKATFAGIGRAGAVAFSIGTSAYLGTGNDNSGNFSSIDFWEWNQISNSWTQKANLPGSERRVAGAFSIGGTGFICTGWDGTSYFTDLWEYDPAPNGWTQSANFQGAGRSTPVSFSIGGYGYIGTGATPSLTNDFWEYHSVYTGIKEEPSQYSILIFPNPFSDVIRITLQRQDLKQVSFTIKNFSEQIVFSVQENDLKKNYTKAIDLSFLSKGIYFLDVDIDGERTVKKIVK